METDASGFTHSNNLLVRGFSLCLWWLWVEPAFKKVSILWSEWCSPFLLKVPNIPSHTEVLVHLKLSFVHSVTAVLFTRSRQIVPVLVLGHVSFSLLCNGTCHVTRLPRVHGCTQAREHSHWPDCSSHHCPWQVCLTESSVYTDSSADSVYADPYQASLLNWLLVLWIWWFFFLSYTAFAKQK